MFIVDTYWVLMLLVAIFYGEIGVEASRILVGVTQH
jgi:hypothetical protein